MRSSVVLLLISLAGILGGAVLIGLWALGTAIIFDSLAVGVYALFHDDGTGPMVQQIDGPKTLNQVLDRLRSAA